MNLPTVELDFTEQPPIPPRGIARANELMASGRLFRYGEAGAEELDVAALERDFAASVGARFCVATNSCGASLAVALRAVGVMPGDKVLMNAFTLAPVPGSVAHVGGEPVFVGITSEYLIDFDDFSRKAESTGAKFLMLSHMRGHIADLDKIVELCDALGVMLIEDCAHTMGAFWDGRPTGTFGSVGCFSTQTFKHINSGEGGLLVTDDEDIAAQAILLSGSYMLYEQHGAAPPNEVFERHRATTPNWSMRMSALAAAVAHPQIEELPERRRTWNERYERIANALTPSGVIDVPNRDPKEGFAASSIQFTARGLTSAQIIKAIEVCAAHGVYVKWFGSDRAIGFTSRFDHWRYAAEQSLGKTSAILHGLCDMRIPLSMSLDECDLIAEILRGAFEAS
ncbi:MAG: DegT/DnrJ/EryC1/StrS aminotransferase family protein [Acidimicrobiia bacterium]|nr:DegT/DnrJ/EryC1/StrS aminotransferase family protein [Acidimicrobiia bacterium]